MLFVDMLSTYGWSQIARDSQGVSTRLFVAAASSVDVTLKIIKRLFLTM